MAKRRQSKERVANRRVRQMLFFLTLAFAGLFGRAVWLQGVQAGHLSSLAKNQQQETQTVPAGRGAIFDRTGVQLAIGEQTTTITADPHRISNALAVADAAHRILGVPKKPLVAALRDKSSRFAYVARFADADHAKTFLEKNFPGIVSYPEERRTYPQTAVASQVLGFAGVENTGLTGLELEYNRKLQGRPGKETIVRDPTGRTIDMINATPVREGVNVFSTIDHTIQAQAETVLAETVQKWGAKNATAVVLDPSSGEILAMAQTPRYDANRTGSVPGSYLRNRAITDTYEPGSTFKLVTIIGGLSEGFISPSTRFTLPYALQYAPYEQCPQCVVHDSETRGTETFTVSQILSHSSNVGAVAIATRLGWTRFDSWVRRFGFGRPTGVDFPGESPGTVLPLAEWSDATIGNMPIGQGVAVTPLQMAAMYGAVANDGVWIQPHLVTRVGGVAPRSWKKHRIFSASVAAEVKTMLTGVVTDPGATGTEAAIPGYSVAGKTGTSQVPDGHGGYSTSDYTATFIGMVPAKHPRLVVLVKVDSPTNAIYGGVVAAPAFASIAKFDLQYLNVPPDATSADVTALSDGG